MDLLDQSRLCEGQEIVAALELTGVVGKLRPAEVVFAETLGLDHRPHGAVHDEDALAEQPL